VSPLISAPNEPRSLVTSAGAGVLRVGDLMPFTPEDREFERGRAGLDFYKVGTRSHGHNEQL